MSSGWIVFILCIIVVLGAGLPLIRPRHDESPPPPKKTLRDWRNEQ